MKYAFCASILTIILACINPVNAHAGVERVNIYMGHFLLQSWPGDKRPITMEVDTTLPPDTLVFQAIAVQGGLKNTTLQIRDLQGTVIDEVNRVTRLEDETEATFIYVLNSSNITKIKSRKFCVVLTSHLAHDADEHNIALILLDNSH